MLPAFFGGMTFKLILVGVVALGLVGAFYKWKDDLKEAIYQEFYAAQVEEAMKEQQKEIAKLQATIALREEHIKELESRTERVVTRTRTIEKIINSTPDPGAVAPIIRDTIERLRQKETSDGKPPVR